MVVVVVIKFRGRMVSFHIIRFAGTATVIICIAVFDFLIVVVIVIVV